jgi:hypothetical protein
MVAKRPFAFIGTGEGPLPVVLPSSSDLWIDGSKTSMYIYWYGGGGFTWCFAIFQRSLEIRSREPSFVLPSASSLGLVSGTEIVSSIAWFLGLLFSLSVPMAASSVLSFVIVKTAVKLVLFDLFVR